MGRVIHHSSMTPFILRDENYYSASSTPIPAYLVCDVEVVSDRGTIRVNIPGLAIAATNELGLKFKTR